MHSNSNDMDAIEKAKSNISYTSLKYCLSHEQLDNKTYMVYSFVYLNC